MNNKILKAIRKPIWYILKLFSFLITGIIVLPLYWCIYDESLFDCIRHYYKYIMGGFFESSYTY